MNRAHTVIPISDSAYMYTNNIMIKSAISVSKHGQIKQNANTIIIKYTHQCWKIRHRNVNIIWVDFDLTSQQTSLEWYSHSQHSLLLSKKPVLSTIPDSIKCVWNINSIIHSWCSIGVCFLRYSSKTNFKETYHSNSSYNCNQFVINLSSSFI